MENRVKLTLRTKGWYLKWLEGEAKEENQAKIQHKKTLVPSKISGV